MPIEVYDTAKFAHDTKKRTVVINTNRFHAWIHYYKPDQIDEMHCHNQAWKRFVLIPCPSWLQHVHVAGHYAHRHTTPRRVRSLIASPSYRVADRVRS